MQYTTVDYRKRVFHAMNYISQNIEWDLPLEEIAETVSFSMFHFHRIFKAVAGENLQQAVGQALFYCVTVLKGIS